jgi:hypothetical protein
MGDQGDGFPTARQILDADESEFEFSVLDAREHFADISVTNEDGQMVVDRKLAAENGANMFIEEVKACMGYLARMKRWLKPSRQKHFPEDLWFELRPKYMYIKHAALVDIANCGPQSEPFVRLTGALHEFVTAVETILPVMLRRGVDTQEGLDARAKLGIMMRNAKERRLTGRKGVVECANEGCDTLVVTPKYCGRCRVVAYCGTDCQHVHWKGGHRTECVKRACKATPAE